MVLLPLVPVCLLVAAALFGQFHLEVRVATLLLSGAGLFSLALFFSFFLEVSRSRRSKRRDRNTMFGGGGGGGGGGGRGRVEGGG